MTEAPAPFRLVLLRPADGMSGVSDYADALVEAIRPLVEELVEIRTDGAGRESMRRVQEVRRRTRDVCLSSRLPVVVHAEVSAGSLGPFWGLAAVPRTAVATVSLHDAPLGVWFPFRTAALARRRVLSHAVHYPIRPILRRLEARVYDGRTLIALSGTGARAVADMLPASPVVAIPLLVERRPDLPPPSRRPRAIGLFGHVYRGKGFDTLADLRRELDPAIAIRVAGRGTELLPAIDGVEIIGAVEGTDEDAFFSSVRALVLPYDERHFYGRMVPASAVAARALAYATPLVASRYGALAELDRTHGAVHADADERQGSWAAAGASAVARILDDPEALDALSAAARHTGELRSASTSAQRHVDLWRDLLAAR